MKADEFVHAITGLKPRIEDFEASAIPEELSRQWVSEFEINQIGSGKSDNEILNLISNYDLEKLRINDITFDPDYQEDDQYVFIGWDALPNRIAIHKSSGKIVSYYPEGDRIDFACAADAEKFLDALYEVMKFSKEKMINLYSEEIRDGRSMEVAYTASLKAGGEEYEDYYKSVLLVE